MSFKDLLTQPEGIAQKAPPSPAPTANESLLKELSNTQTILKKSDMSDAGKTDVTNKADAAQDISFSLMRNTINTNGEVSGSDITDYIERAEELNDEVDTVPFGLETDDGQIVKVYVNAEQADKFEEAMKNMLGLEDDIEEAINRLTGEFDIVDVVWPRAEDEDGEEEDPDADLSIDDTSNLEDPEDDLDFAEDEYDVVAAVDGGPPPKADPATGKPEDEDDSVEDEPTEDDTGSEDEDPDAEDEDADAEDEEDEEDEDPDDDPDKPKKRKKKKAQPAEPASAAESKNVKGNVLSEEADSPSQAAAIKLMTSKGLHIAAMDEKNGVVYIEDSQGDEYVMRGDKKLSKEKHGKKLMSLTKEDTTQEKEMTIGSKFLTRILGENQLNEAKITPAKVKAAHDRADRAELAVEREQGRSGLGRSNEKVRELRVKAQKLRSAAYELEREMKAQDKKVNEAAGEDMDGVKDGFNIPLDSQARAMAAKLKLPFAKRLIAFHFMCGVPGRYMNTADVTEAVASAADMLRKKVAVRRAFVTLYEGLANAKGLTIPKEDGAVQEAKQVGNTTSDAKRLAGQNPEKIMKARGAVKKAKQALQQHLNTYDGGTGAREKALRAEIEKATLKLKKLQEEVQLDEAKNKRGGFIQKLLESVLMELGIPSSLITTTGPAAIGTGIYRTAELIEQDSTLERALRLLATRLGIRGNDATASVEEGINTATTARANKEGWYVLGTSGSPLSGPFDSEDEAREESKGQSGKVNIKYGKVVKMQFTPGNVQEAVDVGNDDFAQAVTNLVSALGIPDDILERRRTQVVQALRQKRGTLRNRAQVLTMIGRLQDILKNNTVDRAAPAGTDTQANEGAASRWTHLSALQENLTPQQQKKILRDFNKFAGNTDGPVSDRQIKSFVFDAADEDLDPKMVTQYLKGLMKK